MTTRPNVEGKPSATERDVHITATVRSQTLDDKAACCSVTLWIAAREARQGHHRLASDIKKAVDSFHQRARTPLATVATHRAASQR